MKNRAKKQLREQEKESLRKALAEIHQLKVKNANLSKAYHICDGENKRLKAMFEQLQTEYKDLETSSDKERDAAINKLAETIDNLKRPWWEKLRLWLMADTKDD